jgi:hypothetical protein
MKALAQKKKEKPPLFKLGDFDVVNVVVNNGQYTFENWTGESPIDVHTAKIGDLTAWVVKQEDKALVIIDTPMVVECKVPEEQPKVESEEEIIVEEE